MSRARLLSIVFLLLAAPAVRARVGAQGEAQALLSESQARLQAETAARQAELDAKLAKQVATAEAEIAEAKKTALKELRTSAVTVAQAATERLAGLKVTKKAAEAALRDVLAEAA